MICRHPACMNGRNFILFVVVLISLNGCNSSHVIVDSGLGDNTQSEKAVFAPSTPVSWPLIRDVVLNECRDCHKDMAAYSSIASRAGEIMNMVSRSDSKQMPPIEKGYPPLSACHVAILKKWVSMGAPVQSEAMTANSLEECAAVFAKIPPPTTTPEPSPDPTPTPKPAPSIGIVDLPLTYATLKNEILDKKCTGCHAFETFSDASDTLFTPYAEITKRPDLWSSPGRESKLVQILLRTDEKRMPPPRRKEALPQEEIDFIIKWIDAGYPR